ncbi:MAG: hypothetical protein HQM11_07955 [SAR324 cluster bacterium]|nr:hypothetical protein [SAR324 cluster bacterium]
MAREKKQQLLRLTSELDEKLEDICSVTRCSKTMLIERILRYSLHTGVINVLYPELKVIHTASPEKVAV